MSIDNPQFKLQDVRRRVSQAAPDFDNADFVHRACFDGLLERLEPVTVHPRLILDLGAASGRGSRRLARCYRKSRVFSLDCSAAMLKVAKSKRSFLSRTSELQADALQLPLRSASVDMIFANLLLPWIDNLPACLQEINRVLKKGGLFAFSTLGPDTFAELRQAWQVDDDNAHVGRFADMHDIGDALLRAGLRDPVVDVDHLAVTYRDPKSLFADLTACGVRNSLSGRRRSLMGKRRFRRLLDALEPAHGGGQLSISIEQVFGHAWGSGPLPEGGVFHVPADSIPRRR